MKRLANGTCRFDATVRSKLLPRAFRLRYVFDSRFAEYVTPYGDPLVIALLPICACHGEDLVVRAPVTRDLMRQVPKILLKFKEFYPEFSEIQIVAESYVDPPPPAEDNRLTASFLSLGLDSLYTLFRNKDTIDLVIVNAFDLLEWEDSYLEMVLEGVRATLQKLGSRADILVVRSNIFQLASGPVDWGKHFHGACLASVAHVFSGGIASAFIAATYPLENVCPWGSHPELDPLWSTASTQIVHDSPIKRLDKIKEMAKKPELFEHLRVCYHYFRTKFNCGYCSKCISAFLSLRTAGVLDHCKTLPRAIEPQRLPYQIDMASSVGWMDLDRWIDALGDGPGEEQLKTALLVAQSKWHDSQLELLFWEKSSEMIELGSKGRYPECSTTADLLLEMDPYDPIANYYKGLCLFWYHRKLPDAVTYFKKASAFGYDEFLCLYHAGLAGILSGGGKKAVSSLLSAVKLASRRFSMRISKDAVRFVLIRTGLYPHLLRKYFTLRHRDGQGPKVAATKDEAHHGSGSAGSISQLQHPPVAPGKEH